MKAALEAWFEGQLDLDPQTLIFIDETAATHQDGAPARAGSKGRALSGCGSSRPLEDDDDAPHVAMSCLFLFAAAAANEGFQSRRVALLALFLRSSVAIERRLVRRIAGGNEFALRI